MANQEIYLNSTNELLNSTISLLERGEKEIALKDEYRDLIFILGDTAIDIPFIQWITGDYANTTVTDVEKSSAEFINDENDQIVEFALKYQKGCPELFSEDKPNIFYYGCFCDDRSTSVDIATTYITNKVLSHAERIKIIFVVNYSSLEKGVDREIFIRFLKHVSDFVKDIEKYRNSLAMIAIGVGEQNLKKDGDSLLVGDIQLIRDVGNFLLELRQYIADKQKDPVISVKDETFYENALKFFDIILQKDDERYKKIGIFRKLDEWDSTSNIAALQEEKNNMNRILCDELTFTEKLDRDFRCRISEKSEPYIDNLVEEINNAVWLSAKIISGTVQEHYQNHVQNLRRKLEYFASGQTIVDANPVEAVSFKFKNEYYTISSLVDEFKKSMTVKGLVNKIKDVVFTLDIMVPDIEIQNIERFVKYIDILQGISKKEIGTKAWGNLFKDFAEYISESKKILQNDIDTGAEKVKHRIELILANIVKNIRENYNEKLKSKFSVKAMEIQKLRDVFSKEYDNIFKMTEDIKRLKTIDSLVEKLQNNENIPGIAASKRYITNIANEGRYFMFLHFLSEKILDNGSSTWSEEFKEVTDFLHDSETWYSFLSDLYTKFSEYGIQIERKNYVDFLERSRDSDIFFEANVTPINFEIFLRKIRNLNVAEYESIKKIRLTESRLSELNQLINFTLKHNITIQCSDTHMFVKGDFVSLQEVSHILLTHNGKNCKEFYFSGSHRKYINIFALNTLFIDRDVKLQGKKIQLIYISPRWEVIGNRVINLNGSNGSIHYRTKANDGFEPGSDGDHGKPGEPGGPGGIFFGIGGIFVNGSNLTITAHGGDGSPGQDGGNGCDGSPGVGVKLPRQVSSYHAKYNLPQCCHSEFTVNLKYSEEGSKISITKNGFRCKRMPYPSIPYTISWFLLGDYPAFLEYYNLLGTPGKKGGSGGNGGKGGIGGNPGSVKIVEMEKSSEINTYASNGKEGHIGEGGWGGNGGKDGEDAFAYCLTEQNPCFFCILSYSSTVRWVSDTRADHNRRGLSGTNGRNGANSENIKAPEPAISIHEPGKIINKYKRYLRESLTDDIKKYYLIEFYEQMNKNVAVRKVSDTAGLVGEFIDLEDQYYSLKKEVDFYPFYKNLLERIGEYSECAENCDASRDDKIVRSYLYAAVLSKINSLKESNETDLIIDIEKYFDTIKMEIDLLQDLENVNSKANAVDMMKKEYKYRIDKKIEEARYFIEKSVDPEINKISRDIDYKIDLLLNETIYLKKKTQKEKDDFEEKKEELKEALKLKKVFDLFKRFGRVISFLVPYGMAISAAIELGTSVAEYFSLGNIVKPLDLSNAAAKLNAIENNIKMIRIENTDYLNNVLNELSEKTIQYPEELGCMSSKVTDMKNRLNDIRTHKLQYSEVRKLEQELKDTLRAKEIDLERQTTEKSSYVIEMVKKFAKVVEVGSLFVETYNKNKVEDEKIDAINTAIKQKENELILLREYEEQIYETVRPALQNMKGKLQVFANEPNKISQVSLDVGKWWIQSALKDVRIQMQRVTEEMHVKAELARCLEKLEEAISLIITIYDRIQQYQDEQILSNHIANVCSVSPSTLSIMDQNLVNVTSYLEWSIRSSLVLKNYQSALNAFKQWVFPFASHYLEGSMISSRFQLDGNIHNLVFNAAKEIQALKKKISLYKASAKDTDETLIRGEFNCRCISCEPFFVWKDEQYRTEISRLLSGETVALKADVRLSEPGKDAIKFKFIKLHFKTKNETIQSRLDEKLKMFDVSATHIGNSYYRYDDEIYLITSPKRSIFYSFEENTRTGNPVRENEVYTKIKEGNLMLSPYTMWILKLNATKKSSFRELNIYKGKIDLELEGKGSYVINNFGYEDDGYAIDTQLGTSIESEFSYRAVRSLVRRRRSETFATSSSVSSLTSPINSICNFLKIYTISLITNSFNRILNYGSRALKIDDTISSFQMTSMNSVQNKFSNEMQESDISNLSKDLIEKRIDAIDLTLKDPELKSNNIPWKYSIAKSLNASTESNEFNEQVKPFILNEQESKYYNQSVQVPDLSYSLLFADFIARSFTGVKYQSEMDESLMSRKQVIFKRCNESCIKNENDIIQNLRLFCEMNESSDRSWFSSVKRSFQSVFQSLGYLNKEETDEYICDIRNLFV